jgi:hypothetical protein
MITQSFLVFVILEPTYCPIGVIAVSAPSVNNPIPTISSIAPRMKARSISAGTGTTVTNSRRTIPVTGRTDDRDSDILGPSIVFLKILRLNLTHPSTHFIYISITYNQIKCNTEIFLLPSFFLRGGDAMYITLEELLLLAAFIVALLDYVRNHDNKKK